MSDQPRTRREMRERERRGPGAAAVVGVLAVIVLLAAVWFGKDLFLGSPTSTTPNPGAAGASSTADSEPSTPAGATTEATSTPSETTSADPVAAQVAACREGWQLQTAAKDRAATVLGEWKRHLDIMNALQARKISLAKAKQDWGPTTANASPHIVEFHEADKAYTSASQRCTPPADPASTNPDAQDLATCAASMQVVDGILAKARAAIEPWETHLKDQSHFKAGGITAAKAEALWRQLWQQGLQRNEPYFQAVAAGAKAGCPLAG